jgi:hypothetical protein
MFLMMSENIARNMYSSQGIINYPTQLHLLGHFRILYHDARKHECQVYNYIPNNVTIFTKNTRRRALDSNY